MAAHLFERPRWVSAPRGVGVPKLLLVGAGDAPSPGADA